MKKIFFLICLLGVAAYFVFSSDKVSDPEFQRVISYVKQHSSKSAVSQMLQTNPQGVRPSDWVGILNSTGYSAANIPMEPFNVIMLSWSFVDNGSLKEVYASDSKFLTITGDDFRHEVVVRGYAGWQTEPLFERAWSFPEVTGNIAASPNKRNSLTRLIQKKFPPRAPADAKYLMRSGVIVYHVESGKSGGLIDVNVAGNTVVYLEDWGNREAMFVRAILDTVGIRDRASAARLVLGETEYEIDYLNKNGTKKMDPAFKKAKYTEAALTQIGGVREGTEEILGRTCTLWTTGEDQVCVWNQIALIERSAMFGKRINLKAVYISENEVIPPFRFSLPDDISF